MNNVDQTIMKHHASKKRRILISPLNWGLGHATRLLPVIDALLKDGHNCLIAGETPSIDIIREAFPNLEYIEIKGFKVRLSKSPNQLLKLLEQLPRFLFSIARDKKTVKSLISRHNIDLIISDNRYGFRYKKVSSVIITHQTSLYTGLLMCCTKPFIQLILHWWISRFDSCWIPDIDETPSIAGKLSIKQLNKSTHKIGILSRLSLSKTIHSPLPTIDPPDVLIILSGPEPQRSQFEMMISKRFINSDLKVVLLQAQPGKDKKKGHLGSITFLSHCDAQTYYQLLSKSRQIICRSGYSTLMDLFYANRKAILIPTPGQYEQMYLARHMHDNFNFLVVKQNRILTSSHLAFYPDKNRASAYDYSSSFSLPELP